MPELVIAGERLQCRDALPPFRLMELASAMSSSEPMRQMGGMHDFVLAVLLPEERDKFTAKMRSLDDDPDVLEKLNTAVGELMVSYTARPTERPSASPSGADSTGESLKADSSSPVTARVVNLSPRDGARTAS